MVVCPFSLGTQEAGFPGMLNCRTFRVVLVRQHHGVVENTPGNADAEIDYRGAGTSIRIAFLKSTI